MHSRGVIHRDLKPENILVVEVHPTQTENSGEVVELLDVKIADFGLSKIISEGASFAKTCVGTPQYWAPEVLGVQAGGGSYGQAADFWGLGVVLFVMLSGRYPFDGRKKPLEEQIQTASFNMDTARWRSLSEEAKDLVRGLLRVNPIDRLQLEDCLIHPWVEDVESACRRPDISDQSFSATPDEPQAELKMGNLQRVTEEKVSSATSSQVEGSTTGCCHPVSLLSDDSRTCMDTPERRNSDVVDASQQKCFSPALPSEPQRGTTTSMTREFVVNASATMQTSFFWKVVNRRWRHLCVGLILLSFLVMLHSFTHKFVEVRAKEHAGNHTRTPTEATLGGGKVDKILAYGSDSTCCTKVDASGSSCPAKQTWQSIPKASNWQEVQVPVVSLQELTSGGQCQERETIFRLGELLKLQVSIIGSLEVAALAFHRADRSLADDTYRTFVQARDLFQNASNVISRYADLARQVSQLVLPDLKLAVHEEEPGLAMSLIVMVKTWVQEMRGHCEAIRSKYSDLQESVVELARRAQHSKTHADKRLWQAAQAFEAEGVVASTSKNYALGVHTHDQQAGVSVCIGEGVAVPKSGATALEAPGPLNRMTRQLFESLGQLGTEVRGLEDPIPENGDQLDVWRRDVLDLLFMAPGIIAGPASLQHPISLPEDAPDVSTSAGAGTEVMDEGDEDGGSVSEEQSTDTDTETHDGSESSGIGQHVQSRTSVPEFKAAACSSTVLLRALRELRRVDTILEGCSSFWANMGGTVDKLAHMKEHAEALVNYASKNPRLRERFQTRLVEYTDFWASLERICRQYCKDHQATSERMRNLVRQVASTVDLAETLASARGRVVATASDVQTTHS